MAYSIISQNQGHTESSGTTVDCAAFTPAAGNCLIAWVFGYTNGADYTFTLSDTTGSNGTWSAAGAGLWSSGNGQKIRCFYLTNAAATSSTIRATASTTVNTRFAIWIAEVSGLSATPYLDSSANAQDGAITGGADTLLSGSTGTLASQPALVIGITYVLSENETPSAGTGYTALTACWYQTAGAPEHKRVTVTSGVQATWGTVAASHGMSGVAVFLESGAGAPVPSVGSSYRIGVWAR